MTRSKDELRMRIGVAEAILKHIRDDPETMGDPRAESAIAHYIEQKEKLEQELINLDDKPEPIVIGLQAARLTGEVPR